MADVTVRREEDFEAAGRGAIVKARAGLGITSFGMQVIKLPPNADGYPDHDHAEDGQEEAYVVLEGSATMTAGGEEYLMEPGVYARVASGTKRKFVTGDEPFKMLALGGVPGAAYDAPEFTEETGGDSGDE